MSNNITRYHCDVCNVSLKTKNSLHKHYESKKHKQKTSNLIQEQPNQTIQEEPNQTIKQEDPNQTIQQEDTNKITRNHKNCQNTEVSVTEFFEKNVGKIINLNGRECKIVSMSKKKGKNDTAFSIEDVINKNVLKIGIQTKQDNATFVENWINIEKFIHKINKQNKYTEKEKTDAIEELYQLENIIFNDINTYKRFLKKYNNRKGKSNAKFVKLGMCVSLTEDKNIPIKSKLLKMLFITGGVDNISDEFYYHSQKHNETFEITNLKKVDEDFIENTNLYFHPRMIYTSSGKTQLNLCDYFSFKGGLNGKTFSVDFKTLINTPQGKL